MPNTTTTPFSLHTLVETKDRAFAGAIVGFDRTGAGTYLYAVQPLGVPTTRARRRFFKQEDLQIKTIKK